MHVVPSKANQKNKLSRRPNYYKSYQVQMNDSKAKNGRPAQFHFEDQVDVSHQILYGEMSPIVNVIKTTKKISKLKSKLK